MNSNRKAEKKPVTAAAFPLEDLNRMVQNLSQDTELLEYPIFIDRIMIFKNLLKGPHQLFTTEFLGKFITLLEKYYASNENCLQYAKLIFKFAVSIGKADIQTYGVLMNMVANSHNPNIKWARKLLEDAQRQKLGDDTILLSTYMKAIRNKKPAPDSDDILELMGIWETLKEQQKAVNVLASLMNAISRSSDPGRGKKLLALLEEAKTLNIYNAEIFNCTIDGLARSRLQTKVKHALILFDEAEKKGALDHISCSIMMNVFAKSTKTGGSQIAIDFLEKQRQKNRINKDNYVSIFSSMINILQTDQKGSDIIFQYVKIARSYGDLDSNFYSTLFFALAECKEVSIDQILELYEEVKSKKIINSYIIGAVLTALAKKNPPGIQPGLELLKEAERTGIVEVPSPFEGSIDLHSMTYGEAFFTLCRIFEKMAQSKSSEQKLCVIHGRGLHTRLKKPFDKKSPLQSVTERVIHLYRPYGIIKGTNLISKDGATEITFCPKKRTSLVTTRKTWAKQPPAPETPIRDKSEKKSIPLKKSGLTKKNGIIESYNKALKQLAEKIKPDSGEKALSLFSEAEKNNWVNQDTYLLVMQILSANEKCSPKVIRNLYDRGVKKGALQKDCPVMEGHYKIKEASQKGFYHVADLKPKITLDFTKQITILKRPTIKDIPEEKAQNKPKSKLKKSAAAFVPFKPS